MAFFRHKQKFDKFDKIVITPYGNEYFVFDGFLFIPDIQKLDIQDTKKRNYVFINHIEVPDKIKERYLKIYPQYADEINLKKGEKDAAN